MAEAQSPRPPNWLFKNIINPTMKAILQSPIHGILSNGLSLITFTGRKSGKQFTTPAAYHWIDNNTVIFMTRSPWWKNFQNGEMIQIRIKGKSFTVTPEIIKDNDVVWEYLSKLLERYKGNTRRVGIMASKDATLDEIRQHATGTVIVKAQLH